MLKNITVFIFIVCLFLYPINAYTLKSKGIILSLPLAKLSTLGAFEIEHENWSFFAKSGTFESESGLITAVDIRGKLNSADKKETCTLSAKKMHINLNEEKAYFIQEITIDWEDVRLISQFSILDFDTQSIEFKEQSDLFTKDHHLSSKNIKLNLDKRLLDIGEAKLKIKL